MQETFNKRILIVDDHPIMRKGLAGTIESEIGFEVVGQLESAEQALKVYGSLEVDLMIVDVSLPGMNGIELVKNVIFQNPDQIIVIR
jgi:YesN/AraC family two-component response regulator